MKELISNFQGELASIEAQEAAERAEARRRANGGTDLTPIFARIESFMYRIAKLERQNIDFEKRIAALEAERQAPSSSGGLTVTMNLEAKQREMRLRMAKRHKRECARVRPPKLGRGIYVAPLAFARSTNQVG